MATRLFTDYFPYVDNKVLDYAVPDAYTGTPANTVTTDPLPAGTYELGFSFEANFNTKKGKALRFRFTGDYTGNEFSETVKDTDPLSFKSRYYMFPKVITEGAVITHGIEFYDAVGGQGFTIPFCDVIVKRVK